MAKKKYNKLKRELFQISVVFQHMRITLWGIIYSQYSYWIVSGPLCSLFFVTQPKMKVPKLWMKDTNSTKVGVDHRVYPISFVQFKYIQN